MKNIRVGTWVHTVPDEKYNKDGRRAIIRRLCFGSLETIIYGITNDLKYYFEHHIIEGIQEEDIFFKYINKVEILQAVCSEIDLCKKYHEDEMMYLFQIEKKKIENDEILF